MSLGHGPRPRFSSRALDELRSRGRAEDVGDLPPGETLVAGQPERAGTLETVPREVGLSDPDR